MLGINGDWYIICVIGSVIMIKISSYQLYTYNMYTRLHYSVHKYSTLFLIRKYILYFNSTTFVLEKLWRYYGILSVYEQS